jgi:hypothetical protein
MAELPIPLPLLIGIVILALAEGGYNSEEARRCVRGSRVTGDEWVHEIINADNPGRCIQLFRMKPETFMRLCQELRSVGLTNSRHVTIAEQLAIFLFMTSQDASNRLTQETFQHSGETIHRYLFSI